jgi:hypothetical protein
MKEKHSLIVFFSLDVVRLVSGSSRSVSDMESMKYCFSHLHLSLFYNFKATLSLIDDNTLICHKMLLTKDEIRDEVQFLLTVHLTSSFLCMSINEIVILKMNYLFLCIYTAETSSCVMSPMHTLTKPAAVCTVLLIV